MRYYASELDAFEVLINVFKRRVIQFARAHILPQIRDIHASQNSEKHFIHGVLKAWDEFVVYAEWMRRLFVYMDNHHDNIILDVEDDAADAADAADGAATAPAADDDDADGGSDDAPPAGNRTTEPPAPPPAAAPPPPLQAKQHKRAGLGGKTPPQPPPKPVGESLSMTSFSLRRFKRDVFSFIWPTLKETLLKMWSDDQAGLSFDAATVNDDCNSGNVASAAGASDNESRFLIKSAVRAVVIMGLLETHNTIKDYRAISAIAQSSPDGVLHNQLYVDDFEKALIEQTKWAYHDLATQLWFPHDSVSLYLIHVENALNQEQMRVESFLHGSTYTKIRDAIVEVALRPMQTELISRDLETMLRDEKVDDLKRMFELFSLWEGGVRPMAKQLHAHVVKVGTSLRQEHHATVSKQSKSKRHVTAADSELVRGCIRLYRTFKDIIETHMQNNAVMKTELQLAMRIVLNDTTATSGCPPFDNNDENNNDENNNNNNETTQRSVAEVLASFCDTVLRGKMGGGSNHTTERLSLSEIGDVLHDVHSIFQFVTAKDMFQDSYRTYMAKRLLANTSASMDAEREFLQRLKLSEGATFTQKFERMLQDIVESTDEKRIAQYKAQWAAFPHKLAPAKEMEFSVRLLCQGHWPAMYDASMVTIPRCLQVAMDHYSEMYTQANTDNRQVSFVLSEGSMTVRGYFRTGWKDLSVMTLQGIILLQFNTQREWTIRAIAERLRLESETVAKLLHPLIFHSKVIAKKCSSSSSRSSSQSKRLHSEDVVEFCDSFKNPRRKVVVPSVPLRNATVNQHAIDVGRKYQVDAALVRIMKGRRTMNQQELLVEVQRHVQTFEPDVRFMKSRVEHLLTNDYLERDEKERGLLHYVA